MRSLLRALTVLTAILIVGCGGQASGTITAPSQTTLPTLSSSARAPDVSAPSRTAIVAAATRTPRVAKSPAPTAPPFLVEAQELPAPAGARESKRVPDVVRTFLQGQLKGLARLGQPHGFLVPYPRDVVFANYQTDLQDFGWESIPLATDIPDNPGLARFVIAQKATVRATIAFVHQDARTTIVYMVFTRR